MDHSSMRRLPRRLSVEPAAIIGAAVELRTSSAREPRVELVHLRVERVR
jgi:hypothetical protein